MWQNDTRTGSKRYSTDLKNGGLELPARSLHLSLVTCAKNGTFNQGRSILQPNEKMGSYIFSPLIITRVFSADLPEKQLFLGSRCVHGAFRLFLRTSTGCVHDLVIVLVSFAIFLSTSRYSSATPRGFVENLWDGLCEDVLMTFFRSF